jgi:hypothetical protein
MKSAVRCSGWLFASVVLALSFAGPTWACGLGKECDRKSPPVSKTPEQGGRAPASVTEAPRLQRAFEQAPAWQNDPAAFGQLGSVGRKNLKLPWSVRGQEPPSLGGQGGSDSFAKRAYFRN